MRGAKVSVRDLRKRYGAVKALDGVTFDVESGEYFVILGPVGSGRSTLLKCIAGLERPDSGDILFDGESVLGLPPEKRLVGYMPPGYALFPHMTVWENVAYGLWIRGYPRREVEERVEEALKLVGLLHRADSYPHQLSGGQRQRIALARALASGARVLLLDEPLTALDAVLTLEVRREVRRLAKSLGLTVIHVTHNQEEAMAVADRVAVMRRGRVEQVGSPLELYLRPKSLFVARFVGGENNFLEGEVVRRDGPYVEVDLGVGAVKVFGAVEPGRAVVAVRPEKLKFVESGVLEGRVEAREFLGKVYKYVVRLRDGRSVLVKSRERVAQGAPVKLSFDPLDAVVFPYPPEGLAEALRYE
ncbi:MAG: ABC transporter ATP-binding protein [Thermofilum sp.]|nr:ABC transporter ATP-binding protein [Thermofilum sp.]